MSALPFEAPVSWPPEEPEGQPELPATPAGQHREEHGLCYRTDCVAKFGAPLVMRSTVLNNLWQ